MNKENLPDLTGSFSKAFQIPRSRLERQPQTEEQKKDMGVYFAKTLWEKRRQVFKEAIRETFDDMGIKNVKEYLDLLKDVYKDCHDGAFQEVVNEFIQDQQKMESC